MPSRSRLRTAPTTDDSDTGPPGTTTDRGSFSPALPRRALRPVSRSLSESLPTRELSAAEEHGYTDAAGRPDPAGEGADDEALRRCRRPQLGETPQALDGQDDGEPLRRAGQQRGGHGRPLQHPDPGSAAEDRRVLRAS